MADADATSAPAMASNDASVAQTGAPNKPIVVLVIGVCFDDSTFQA